jgi:YD repeat-containing protein
VTEPEGRTDTITSSGGRITQITDPAGHHWNYVYDGVGDLTDPTNRVALSDALVRC